jgi:hypothetical protein
MDCTLRCRSIVFLHTPSYQVSTLHISLGDIHKQAGEPTSVQTLIPRLSFVKSVLPLGDLLTRQEKHENAMQDTHQATWPTNPCG